MTAAHEEMRAYQRKEYVQKFLEQDVRPDSRALAQSRLPMLTLGSITTADGSAMVRLGNTVVVCGIKAEITRPPPDKQGEGVLIANVQLPPLCSPDFRSGAPSDEAQVLSHFVQEIIHKSMMLRLSDLCISDGHYCWILYCDSVCCNYDGNVKDAALLATIAALKDLKLPSAIYDKESDQLTVDMKRRKPLALNSIPVPLSFTIFDEKIIMVDPTHEEETVCRGQVTLVTPDGATICHMSKDGGAALSPEQLNLCITSAKQRFHEINKILCP